MQNGKKNTIWDDGFKFVQTSDGITVNRYKRVVDVIERNPTTLQAFQEEIAWWHHDNR